MSSQISVQTQSRPSGRRNQRDRQLRPSAKETPRVAVESTLDVHAASILVPDSNHNRAEETDDFAVCWICAEPVKYYAVAECNHRTCHVCAVRLRALYKKLDCTFCKHLQPSVIFTSSSDALFESFAPDNMEFKDIRLSIFFETQEMMDETMVLLKFNCPDPDCVYVAAAGWNDMKLHVRATHGKQMCDMCIRHKKVFAHEHALYAPNQLPLHLPSVPHRQPKSEPKDVIEGGVHPMCEFCRECFFSGDELFTHMRERHEECFICKRNAIRDQYFQNYEALEKHFMHAHYPCTQPPCLVQKFVVFGSVLDLKAHMVEEHGGEMSSRDKKETMRIQADFEFQEVGGVGRRGRRDRGDREREREPPPVLPQPLRPSGQARRGEGFGTNLTATATPSGPNETPGSSRRASPSSARDDADPVVAEQQAAFTARLNRLASNSTSAVAAVKAAIRSYRVSESGARDLISTWWNVLDRDLDATASITVAFVDLLEDEEKKSDLLTAWNGFKLEQRRQFPELVPSSAGTGYAGVAGGVVLNAKHSTASTSSHRSRQVWDRVAQAATSSSAPFPVTSTRPVDRFPPIKPEAPPANQLFRQPQRGTPWASAAQNTRVPPLSVPAPNTSESKTKGTAKAPLALSNSQFPTLPTTSTALPKTLFGGNQSLRKIRNDANSASAWGVGAVGHSAVSVDNETPADVEILSLDAETSGKGKKNKGKQKQTLFTIGTFPS